MSDTPIKPIRLFRFSLRTLLLLMIVGCVLLGWKSNKAHQQREAVEWVRENGGGVLYEYELDANGHNFPIPKPPGPAWLRNLIGIDFFAEVSSVENLNTQVTDVTPLENLTKLKQLWLGGTQVRDMTPLTKLINLEYLWLDGTQVSDVTPLGNLTKLGSLRLSNSQVRDVTPLATLTKLEGLWLNDTQVSEESLRSLRKALPNCLIYSDYDK